MQARMTDDHENYLMERSEYLARKKYWLDRQMQLVGLATKLFFLMMLMLCTMLMLDPARNLMLQYERILAAEANGMERIPELKKQISVLEKQLATLSSQSIESRLSTIEKAIDVGDVDVDEVVTLRQLKTDFETLKSYMFSDPEDLVKLKTLQRDYQEISRNIESYAHKDDVDRELRFLNNIFYTILGLLGILISISGSSWYFTAQKMKNVSIDANDES